MLKRGINLAVPPSSGYTAIGLSIAAALTVLLKYYVVPKQYWVYVPNWNAIGLVRRNSDIHRIHTDVVMNG